MRCHAATCSQYTLRCVHTFNILGRCLLACQYNFLSRCRCRCRIFRCKIQRAACSAGGCRQALANRLGSLERRRRERGVKQRIKLFGLNLHQCFFLCQLAFVHKVNRNFERGCRRPLAVPCLEHIKLTAFNRKLHILHVPVVVFQQLCDIRKLLVYVGHCVLQCGNRLGRPDARNNVLALRIHQVFTIQLLFPGRRVTRKRNACAAIVAHVAKYHCLYVDGGSPACGNVIHPAVYDRPGVIPRTENSGNRFQQLLFRILREVLAHFFFINLFIFCNQILQIVGIKVCVKFHALGFLHRMQFMLKLFLIDLHNDIGEHLDKPSVTIIRKTRIPRFPGHAFDRHVVESKVQYCIHHSRHRSARPRPYGYKEWIFRIAKLFAGNFFRLCHCIINLVNHFLRDLLAVFIILCAGLCRHNKTLRYREPQIGHFRKVRAFATQKILH